MLLLLNLRVRPQPGQDRQEYGRGAGRAKIRAALADGLGQDAAGRAPSGRARTNASRHNRTFGAAGTRDEREQHRERAADEECSAPVTQARAV